MGLFPTKWAEAPAQALEAAPAGVNERAFNLRQIATRAKLLADAIDAAERESIKRRDAEPGASRAKITTLNARWTRAAENRDRKERNFIQALEDAGFGPKGDGE